MKATDITPGQKFDNYYHTGEFCTTYLVTRVTKASIFVKSTNGIEHREGINSVQRYLDKGIYKPA